MDIIRLFPRLCLSVCVCVCLWPTVSEAAQIAGGVLTNVSGDVEVRKRGDEDWVRAVNEMRIGPGDQISSGVNGRARLVIKDSRTDISPLTEFIVGRSVDEGDQNYTELFLRVGKVVSQVDKRPGRPNRFNVITPTAVVGVRGTKQEVEHLPATGTQAKITDGKGFGAPLPDGLSSAAKGVLGVQAAKLSDDNGGKSDGNDKDKKKKKKEKGSLSDEGEETDKEQGELTEEGGAGILDASIGADVATTDAAVDAFNLWMDQVDLQIGSDAGFSELGLLDGNTLEYVVPVDDGLHITVGDRNDPEAFVNTTATLQADAQVDIAPQGLSTAEAQEAVSSIEAIDAPESISVVEEQSSFDDAAEDAVVTSTTLGGVAPTTPTIVPPALPDKTGKTNINQ